MASQTKVKALRCQPTRLSKKAPASLSPYKQVPNTAVSNPRNSRNSGPQPFSRPRTSLLPVPVVNKTNTMARNKTTADKNLSSSDKDKGQVKCHNYTGNAATHPNLAKLLTPQNNGNVLSTIPEDRNTATQQNCAAPVSPPSEESLQNASAGRDESASVIIPAFSGGPPSSSSPTEIDNTVNSASIRNSHAIIPINISGSLDSNLPPSNSFDPWHPAYSEIKAMASEIKSMNQKMSQLDKIEKDVGSLRKEIEGISTRTKGLENALQSHSTDIDTLKSSLTEVTSDIKENEASLERLWAFSEEVASKADQRIHEIKQAIQENIDKIENIGDIKAAINKEVTAQMKDILQTFKQEFRKECGEQIKRCSQATKNELYHVINRNTHDFTYRNLQDQAFFNRHNLILRGISESDRDSAFSQATNFFSSNMKLSGLSIDVAYRLGKPLIQDSTYNRPIVVKFSKIADRNKVWKKRKDISQQGKGKSVYIQPDIPKQLREDLQILYRVQNAALKTNQYRTVEVRNYKLYLDGAEYSAWELEELPPSLRPSCLATYTSDEVLVFYSKHTPLSNHHPSPFEIRGRTFANMEQYLAYRRAKLSGQKHLIQKALLAQDPVEAKTILNALRSDHQEEWKKEVSTIALEGLQAKFRQHPALGEYLISTAPLTLGEASTNSQWGIGFSLEDTNATDKSKWNKQGNLLGQLLMKVRNQMIGERQNQHNPKEGKKPTSPNRNVKNHTSDKQPSAPSSDSRQQPAKTTADSTPATGTQPAKASVNQG